MGRVTIGSPTLGGVASVPVDVAAPSGGNATLVPLARPTDLAPAEWTQGSTAGLSVGSTDLSMADELGLESARTAGRPVARWVHVPSEDGGGRLVMVWEVAAPLPPA